MQDNSRSVPRKAKEKIIATCLKCHDAGYVVLAFALDQVAVGNQLVKDISLAFKFLSQVKSWGGIPEVYESLNSFQQQAPNLFGERKFSSHIDDGTSLIREPFGQRL